MNRCGSTLATAQSQRQVVDYENDLSPNDVRLAKGASNGERGGVTLKALHVAWNQRLRRQSSAPLGGPPEATRGPPRIQWP